MKLVFTGSFDDLQNAFKHIDGTWDSSQPKKKVLRARGGVLNWYESTGTIQLQGKEPGRRWLEKQAILVLDPDGTAPADSEPEDTSYIEVAEDPEPSGSCDKSPPDKYLDGKFNESELVIGIVTAVGTETAHVVSPLTDRLSHFGYEVENIRVSTLLPDASSASEYERIRHLMREGDAIRMRTGNNAILAACPDSCCVA